MPGTTTLEAEVTNISKHCFWLLLGNEELAVAFKDFPWFKNATVEQITNVQWQSLDHLYWPALDIDLSVQSIRDPAGFPLVSKTATEGRSEK